MRPRGPAAHHARPKRAESSACHRLPATRCRTSADNPPPMVLWVAIAGLLIWGSFEFFLRGGGEARRWGGRADVGSSTQVLLVSFLVSLAITVVFGGFRLGLAPLARWTGCVILACGLALRAWSMVVLGGSYSRGLQVTSQQALVTGGPYRFIRHPGYTGSLLVWIGYALRAGSWVAAILVAVVLGVAYFYRVGTEARMLQAEFGAAYQTYQRQTWRLIPVIF